MQVEIKTDSTARAPKRIGLTDRMTEKINELLRRISPGEAKGIAVTGEGEYRLRLYEVEEGLSRWQFVRISNSEMISLKKVKHFNLRLAGSVCVSFFDGSTSYVSHRYVTKSRKFLECEVFSVKKKVISGVLLGAPIGLAIRTVITIVGSYFLGGGSYRAVVPESGPVSILL